MGRGDQWRLRDLVRDRKYLDLYRPGGGRPGIGRAAWWADPDCAGLRPGGDDRFRRGVAPVSRAVGVDRVAEPVSDTSARWWTPSVLCDRGYSRAPSVRPGARVRVPLRLGSNPAAYA